MSLIPIKESDKLSFNDDIISTLLDGIISFRIISFFVAPNTLNSLILSLSVLINPFKIVLKVTIKFISQAIKIIDSVFAPNQMMISGPKATFGKLLIIVINGSIIFFIVGKI